MDIQSKLEREMLGLAVLREASQKSSQICNGMVNILTSFEQRLEKLEGTILPVYQETEHLQRKQENIEKTLASLDHVIGYYNVSREVEPVIRDGPSKCGLDRFLRALDRLQNAINFFEKNNPQSVELENVMGLFETGGDTMSREFKEIIAKYSRQVSPNTLLDIVSVDDELPKENMKALQNFPDSVTKELVTMADWLITHNRDDFMNVYARFRATAVHKSLHNLREHQRANSGGGGASGSASHGASPAVPTTGTSPGLPKYGTRYDTPSRKTSKKIQQLLERKANQMLLKASQSGLTGLGSRRTALLSDNKDDIVEEQEIVWFLTELTAFLRLLQSELSQMMGIIPLPHQKSVLSIILKDSLDIVFQDEESVSSRARRCVARNDFSAVLLLFPVLRHLVFLKADFDKMLEGCDTVVRNKFYQMVNSLHATCGKSLEDFAELVRSENSTPLPRDGTVFEMTSNVVVFLQQLTDLADTVGPLLAQDESYSNALLYTQPWARSERNKAFLGLYIKRILVQLNLTLVSKSDAYSDATLRSVFRLNNSHYLLTALQRTGLIQLLAVVEPECENIYREMIEEQKRLYSQCWNKVLVPVWSSEDVPASVLQTGKLREKDKALIKEKFSAFNKEFEELANNQRGFSMPDVELRASLKRDNKELILPKYQSFYDKYSSTQFTKHTDKYVKYTPALVSSIIDTFFDVAA